MVPVGPKSGDYREQAISDAGVPQAQPAGAELDEMDIEATTPVERRELIVGADAHGQRLDKVLVQMAPEFSRSHLQHLIEQGHAQLDGVVASPASRRLRAGQRLRLDLVPTEQSQAFRPQAMPLTVLFEDEHLLILDKPAGLVVHPAPGNWSGTLLNGLLAHHAAAATLPRAGIVHRLDKDTSGVMMVGKSLAAVTALVRAIAARQVHRRYLALAHGHAPADPFSIDAPIGRDPVVRVRMAVVAGGRPSRTDVQCLAAAEQDGERFSALSCTLHSGRTHQIRVHLSSRGLPLVADGVYGGRPGLGLQRQALHAVELRLAHPISGEGIEMNCAPPSDFAQAWQKLLQG
jgi:23S rRNA pseudouridine1911/1915/1917 synthase